MKRFAPAFYTFSWVIMGFAFTFLVPMAWALAESWLHALNWAGCLVVTLACGFWLWLRTHGSRGELTVRDGFLLVNLVWIVLPAFAALPLALNIYGMSWTRAYFEAMSGLTATGATVLISSHILAEVEKIVDRVLAIDKGALRFDGTLSQLIAQAGGQHVRYNVRAQDGPALLQALRDMGYDPVGAGVDGALVDVPQAEAGDLVFRLASAGVRVTSAAPSAENLESAYLRLVGVDGKPS